VRPLAARIRKAFGDRIRKEASRGGPVRHVIIAIVVLSATVAVAVMAHG
jgi:hypothetical protein